MPRPGFVLDVDRSTPPTLFWRGEGFSLEKLPRRPQPGDLRRPSRCRRSTTSTAPSATPSLNPIDQDPLPTLLFPGMKLTIAFDDVSLPLPKMRRPDVRQRVIEAVLDLAAEAGVDDVHLIAALALHRRMTEAELRHAVGDRVYDAFAPRGAAVPARRRGPRQPRLPRHDRRTARRSRSTSGRPSPTCSSTSTSTSSRWTAAGSRRPPAWPRYRSPAPPPQPDDDGGQPQLHGPAPQRAAQDRLADGQGARRRRRQGLPDRDDAEHRHVPEAVRLPRPSGSGSGSPKDRAHVPRHGEVAARARRSRLARKIFHSIEAPHQMTSVQAGEVEAVHKRHRPRTSTASSSSRSRARPTS